MSDLDDIRREIVQHKRRLQILKERRAQKGIDIEPQILIEIEDIEKEIEKLQGELSKQQFPQTEDITVEVRQLLTKLRLLKFGETILSDSNEAGRVAFIKFKQQIEISLNEFNLLYKQLEEWKEVHNVLHQLQFTFAPCRGSTFSFIKLDSLTPLTQDEQEKILQQQELLLYQVENEWLNFNQLPVATLRGTTKRKRNIAKPYNWFRSLEKKVDEINKTFLERNVDRRSLIGHLSDFGQYIDIFLYQADGSLRDVINEINQHHLTSF
jgi:hypothetical protein